MKFITLNNIVHNILETFKNTTVLQGNHYNLDSSYRKLSIADKLILQENNVRNPVYARTKNYHYIMIPGRDASSK